jgi:hypothetical protein
VRRRAPRGGWPARCDDETLFETRVFIRRGGALLLDAMTLSTMQRRPPATRRGPSRAPRPRTGAARSPGAWLALPPSLMPAARSGACRPLSVAATAGVRMAEVRRIRVHCSDRRLQRESARRAHIGERRHHRPAERTAKQHGDDAAVAQALKKQLSALSDQLSALFHPSRCTRADGTTPRAPPCRELERRAKARPLSVPSPYRQVRPYPRAPRRPSPPVRRECARRAPIGERLRLARRSARRAARRGWRVSAAG